MPGLLTRRGDAVRQDGGVEGAGSTGDHPPVAGLSRFSFGCSESTTWERVILPWTRWATLRPIWSGVGGDSRLNPLRRNPAHHDVCHKDWTFASTPTSDPVAQ
jgi:hypothetical protein